MSRYITQFNYHPTYTLKHSLLSSLLEYFDPHNIRSFNILSSPVQLMADHGYVSDCLPNLDMGSDPTPIYDKITLPF